MKIADQKKYWYFEGLLFIACTMLSSCTASNGISYSFSHGSARFGDNVLAYVDARWMSYLTGLDFYYRPFTYSRMLAMHDLHKAYKNHELKEIHTQDVSVVDPHVSNTLFVLDWGLKNNVVNWDDYGFISLLRNEIRPKKSLSVIQTPEGYLGVALHIRRGGGYDRPLWQNSALSYAEFPPDAYNIPEMLYQDKRFPTRTPPDQWFIQMLRYLRELYPSESMYVYIFTDDPRPDLFAEMYKKELNDPRMVFDYRSEGNSHNKNVLEDFFSMMQFDCVIRPWSGFSQMACHLGRPKIEISPEKYLWEGRKLIITETLIKTRKDTKDLLSSSSETRCTYNGTGVI